MMEKKDANGNTISGEYEGFCVDLVQKLSEMIKFKYKMKAVSDGQFGSLVNGSWNGMVGELLRRVSADISRHEKKTRTLRVNNARSDNRLAH